MHQDDVATVDLHGPAALFDVELLVDQHHSRQVVVSRELSHQPVHARLSAKARRARRHLGNVEDVEALWVHGSGSWPPDTKRVRGHGQKLQPSPFESRFGRTGSLVNGPKMNEQSSTIKTT